MPMLPTTVHPIRPVARDAVAVKFGGVVGHPGAMKLSELDAWIRAQGGETGDANTTPGHEQLTVFTKTGWVRVRPGWLVTLIDGEWDAYTPEAFARHYEFTEPATPEPAEKLIQRDIAAALRVIQENRAGIERTVRDQFPSYTLPDELAREAVRAVVVWLEEATRILDHQDLVAMSVREVVIHYLTSFRADIVKGLTPTIEFERNLPHLLESEDIVGIVVDGIRKRLEGGAPTEDTAEGDDVYDIESAIRADLAATFPGANLIEWVLLTEFDGTAQSDGGSGTRILTGDQVTPAHALGLLHMGIRLVAPRGYIG